MRFAVLGPLMVQDTTDPVVLPSAKQRIVLANLIAAGGRAMRPDRLIDEVWEGEPPAGARKALSWHILRLRDALGNREIITWDGKGYRLADTDGWVDAASFERLQRDGAARLESDPDTASQLLFEGLRLWRGAAYEGLCEFGQLRAEANRLEELRITAIEQRCQAELALGRHTALIPELTTLVSDQPFREALRAHLMLALYRAGRQSDALRVFREGREISSRELGLSPGPALRELERQILNADPALVPRPAATPTPRVSVTPAQLPAGITTFTARDSELDELLRTPLDAADSQVPIVACISGMAGSGKTTLALHAAHRLAEQFEDGQLFLNLHGFSENAGPLAPDDALERLLRGLGVPGDQVPSTTDEKAVLWRSYASARRLLIVLDDAATDEQVRALLPGGSGHVVLVTSRRRLLITDDTRLIRLGALEHDDAIALFDRIIGGHTEDEDASARLHEIIELCGRLPLALQVVASRLRSHPHWTLQDITRRLSHQHRLLSELRIGDRSVATAFHFSYQQLDSEQQRVFRLIGLTTGPDFDPPAAAALTGLASDTAETILEQLVEVHLLEARPGNRFLPHSLIRAFARERCDSEDEAATIAQALFRLRAWYCATARSAARVLRPHREYLPAYGSELNLPAPEFADAVAASQWFDTEQRNLYQLLAEAETRGDDALVWSLADAMRGYFFSRSDRPKWIAVCQAGLKAAQRGGDPVAEGAMLYSLGMAAALSGDYQTAIVQYRSALRLSRQAGAGRRCVEILLTLAAMHLQQAQPGRAAEFCREALGFPPPDIGPLYSDVTHLLGASYWQHGNLADAVDRLHEAVDANRRDELGTLYDTFGTLALALADLGELGEAEACAAEALRLSQERGITHGEASAWSNLSYIYAEMGDFPRAAECANRELDLARRHAMRTHEAYGLSALALARLPTDPATARDHAVEALRREKELRTHVVELDARHCLAVAQLALGEPPEALRHTQTVLRLAQESGLLVHQGRLLTTLAEIQLALAQPWAARVTVSRALALQQTTGHRRGEARSHLLGQRIRMRDGEIAAAGQHLNRARELFDATGGYRFQGGLAVLP